MRVIGAVLVASSLAFAGGQTLAAPDPAPIFPPYSAFDLAAQHISLRPDIDQAKISFRPASSAGGSCINASGLEVQNCQYNGSGSGTIEGKSCSLWAQATPSDVCVNGYVNKNPENALVSFKKDGDVTSKASLSRAGAKFMLRFAADVPAAGDIAYFDGSLWTATTYQDRKFDFPGPVPPGPVYVRSKGSAIYAVTWTPKLEVNKQASDKFLADCKNAPSERDGAKSITALDAYPDVGYVVCIDATTSNGWPHVVDDDQTIIMPNTTGAIIVRHWSTVMPVVASTGAQVGLTTPAFEGAAATQFGLDGGGAAAGAGGGPAAPPAEPIETVVLIPPHQPGAFHLDFRLVDAADLTKTRAVQAIDLIVDKTYVGAFRIGVGYDLGVHDVTYSAKTFPGGSQAEIFGTEASPFELVLGYSLYADGFRNGRSYSLKYGNTPCEVVKNLLQRHVGAFGGLGVASIQGTSVDLLKSLYLGVEIELSRNISIAFTHVSRRTSRLDSGLMVGGPAPSGDIPTNTHIDQGWAFVVSVSTDFFKFAVQPTGAASPAPAAAVSK